jgi:predicted kinase
MRPSRWLVVTGLPATGKTTLARRLAVRYGLPLLAKDSIKEPLLDALPPPDAAASRRLSDASFAVLFALAADLALAGLDAALEGNFRAGEHEPAFPPQTVGVVVAQVLCRIEEPVRLARLAARAGDDARHPGHRDAVQVAAGSRAADDFLALPGMRLLYDGTPRAEQALYEALDALFRKG